MYTLECNAQFPMYTLHTSQLYAYVNSHPMYTIHICIQLCTYALYTEVYTYGIVHCLHRELTLHNSVCIHFTIPYVYTWQFPMYTYNSQFPMYTIHICIQFYTSQLYAYVNSHPMYSIHICIQLWIRALLQKRLYIDIQFTILYVCNSEYNAYVYNSRPPHNVCVCVSYACVCHKNHALHIQNVHIQNPHPPRYVHIQSTRSPCTQYTPSSVRVRASVVCMCVRQYPRPPYTKPQYSKCTPSSVRPYIARCIDRYLL